MPNDNIQQTA